MTISVNKDLKQLCGVSHVCGLYTDLNNYMIKPSQYHRFICRDKAYFIHLGYIKKKIRSVEVLQKKLLTFNAKSSMKLNDSKKKFNYTVIIFSLAPGCMVL